MHAQHLRLMFITNQPEMAQAVIAAGIDRVFLDLERLGKVERQGHLDTVLSDHQWEDVEKVRRAIPSGQLLVRINPMHVRTPHEINMAVEAGADLIMLPMFKTQHEVRRFVELVGGRARTSLLLETPQAMTRIKEIVREDGIDEIHVGLNDLHLGLGLDFMFEILPSGLLDLLSDVIRSRGIRFGFGGIARVGEGLVPAEAILAEHARLGSEMAILSRTFHRRARTMEELRQNVDLQKEVSRIREVYAKAWERGPEEVERDKQFVADLVRQVISSTLERR